MTIRTLSAIAALALAVVLPRTSSAESHGVDLAFRDTTCSPCKDFWRYANGSWLDKTEIPPSYTGIGTGRLMFDHNQEVLHQVLDRAAAKAPTEKDPTLKKLGTLYAVLMDSARADREGTKPIAADLARIDGIKTREDLRKEFAWLAARGVNAPFALNAEVDPKESGQMIGQIYQGGLGLPERDFYFRTDAKSETLRVAYTTYMSHAFQILGATPDRAQSDAAAVMKLETALAESSLTAVQQRDPHALNHKMSVQELGVIAPSVQWTTYFTEAGVPGLASPSAKLDVSMPGFVRRFDSLVASEPIETWRAYLKWTLTRTAAPWLGQKMFDEAFAYQSKLVGTKEPPPRWKRASGLVDASMGEALGKAYVESEFPPSSKTRMLDMVNNLQAVMKERIAQRTWMNAETKQRATKKLEVVMKKIGYPDHWRDYSALQIDASATAIDNLENAQVFEQKRQLAKIGKPVDRTEWGMTPPTVNAYYNPQFNEIVFPAGILQPPRFDPKADDASNYGAIGMVIGHEMTHGFDDQGRQYDAAGNLEDWWTGDDAKNFDALAQKVVEQFNGYIGVDTLHVNGKLTLGENIADLGGLTIAYEAWKRSLHGKPSPVIDGLTGDQRFFLAHAQAWKTKWRPELVRLVVQTDPHSPPWWRVNGPLSNMPQFQQAFHCKAGDPMVAGESTRVTIW